MDWHRLLEICALTATLICDEDGVYDPAHFNDRLLLGLKGTMSEAELHVLRARLHGGILNKARRGELEMRPPVGLVYNAEGALVLDPDRQVQHCLRWLFDTFERTGSACATVRAARHRAVDLPTALRQGAAQGRADVGQPRSQPGAAHAAQPQIRRRLRLWPLPYAQRASMARTRLRRMPRDEWVTLIPGAHAGYISWDEYERNQAALARECAGHGRRSAPRAAARGTRIAAGAGACAGAAASA